MKKRGFELSLNMVVIAAMALIALIVIILIFSGGTTEFVTRIKGFIAEIWASKPAIQPVQ